MEFTNSFVLETKDGVLTGFMLGSPDFKTDAGDCVFILSPESSSVVETPLGVAISELKVTGEHSWRKDNHSIVVLYDRHIFLTIEQDGGVLDVGGNNIGVAKPLPKR